MNLVFEKIPEWQELDRCMDFVNLRILEQIYIPKAKATVLYELSRKLKRYGIKELRIARRLKTLEKIGVIKIIHKSRPLGVWGNPRIELHIQFKILEAKKLLGVE